MPAPLSRRDVLLDAALEVVGTSGLRGLTHRAVDRQAGLPEGSCSAYLRTRQALLVAAAEHVGTALRTDAERLATKVEAHDPASPESVRLVVAQLSAWLKEPTRALARLELTLEATRNPEVASVLRAARDQMETVASAALGGAKDAASRTVVAALDGLLLGALPLKGRERREYLSAGVGVLAKVLPGG